MKTIHLILIIGLMLLAVLCICSCASALQIKNVKVGNQPVSANPNIFTTYISNQIISRASFEKSPTISFDVVFDTDNALWWDGLGNPKDPLSTDIRYRADIIIGGDIYNSKNVWLGFETGNYREVMESRLRLYDSYLSPYVYKDYSMGEHYLDSIPLTPGQTHYTYTLQNPDILCFDAHVYRVMIQAVCVANPTSYHKAVIDAKWDATSGGNSDDSQNAVYGKYQIAQQFTAEHSYILDGAELKLYRVGVLPPGYSLTATIREGVNGKPTGKNLMSITFDTASCNAISTTASYVNLPFYSMGSPYYINVVKGKEYFIVLSSTNLGDATHKIEWRKDTGSWGFPHYQISWNTWNWCWLSNNGVNFLPVGNTYMFRTYGVETGLTYYNSQGYYRELLTVGGFVFNTFGDTYDRITNTASHYVDYKQNNVNTTTSLFIGDCIPSHMKMQNSNLIGKGASFDTCALKVKRLDVSGYSDINVPLTIVLCDKDRKILDYAVFNSYMPVMSTYPLSPFLYLGGVASMNEFKLLKYTVGEEALEPRKAYYMYIGVPSDTYNMDNTYITCDDTLRRTNWSADNIAVGKVVAPDVTYSKDFMGGYVYFETQISYVDTSTKGAFRTTESWVTNFVIWCSNSPPDGLGLPWVAVLIGFIPAMILLGAVYIFMRKWEISLPSYLYSLPVIGGLYISWHIGLLSLWIFVTMVVSFVFISIYNFREPISKVLEVLKPGKVSSLSAIARREEMASEQGVTRRLLQSRRPRPVSADTGVLSPSFSYTYEPEMKKAEPFVLTREEMKAIVRAGGSVEYVGHSNGTGTAHVTKGKEIKSYSGTKAQIKELIDLAGVKTQQQLAKEENGRHFSIKARANGSEKAKKYKPYKKYKKR